MTIFNVTVSNYYSVLGNYDDLSYSHMINVCYQVLFNKDLWNIIRSFIVDPDILNDRSSNYTYLRNGDLAAKLNCFWYIKQIYKEGKKMDFTEYAMMNASSNNNLEMVKWLCDNYRNIIKYYFSTTIFHSLIEAIKKGNMKIVKYLYHQYPYFRHSFGTSLVTCASNYNHLNIIIFLFNKGYDCEIAMLHAADKGNLKIVKWVDTNIENIKCKIIDYSVNFAIMNGYIKIMKWYYTKKKNNL